MAQRKRKTPADLVKSAVPINPKSVKWTDLLTGSEKAYVKDVIGEMNRTPGAALYVVASKLKEALGLSVSTGTIAKTLKERIADGQTKAK